MVRMSIAERALYFAGRLLVRCFYRVTALGLENIPSGGFLLLPNHITWVDAIVLQLACSRPIRYVIDQEHYHNRILHPILRAQFAFRDPGCLGKNCPWRDRLSVSGGTVGAHGSSVAPATRVRTDRTACKCPGRSSLARSTLGLDLFIPGRPIFHQAAQAYPVSGNNCVR